MSSGRSLSLLPEVRNDVEVLTVSSTVHRVSLRWRLALPLAVLLLVIYAYNGAPRMEIAGKGAAAKHPSMSTLVSLPNRSAGILYELWHTHAANLMAQVKAKGGAQLTVERVLRSNGNLSLNDVYIKHGLNGDIWNVEPKDLGFYCLYTKRENDPAPPVPDCPNVSKVARRHAEILVGAGFDYVALDITNWPQVNLETDISVLRPAEVLLDEWVKLRAVGVPTPSVAVFMNAPVASYPDGHYVPALSLRGYMHKWREPPHYRLSESNRSLSHTRGHVTWQWALDNIYNHPNRSSLAWRRPGSGKMGFFVVDNPPFFNATVNTLIESNGGRDDVEVIPMWALFGPDEYKKGAWGFFSPCTQIKNPGSALYTTSMVGDSSVLDACNQPISPGSDGQPEEVSASGSYMVEQCAMPFSSPGHMRGLTLQRLFQRVLETSAPNLFVSSFNEHIGGRQPPSLPAAIAFNMGLPDDPQKDQVWVDSYGAEYSRDIEPNVEMGDRILQVASSCVHLYKAGKTCNDGSVADMPCCSTEDKQIWLNVWSLRRLDAGDRLLTTLSAERESLTRVGGGWVEICHAINGPSVFCVDTNIKDGRDGPFMLYSLASAVPHSTPLYRCIFNVTNTHFFTGDTHCKGQKMERLLGYISSAKGGETLRALHRCISATTGVYSHAVDLSCPEGTMQDGGVLGFVK